MTQATRLTALAAAMGADVKSLIDKIGDLTSITGFSDNSHVAGMLQETVNTLTAIAPLVNGAVQDADFVVAKAGAGLQLDGTYLKDQTTNYLKLATSLSNADKILDGLIKTLTDRVAQIEGGGTGVQIDDTAGDGDTGVVWSADKSVDAIAVARQGLKDELLGGVGPAFDTLKELADALAAENDIIVALTTAVGNRIRFDDVQTLTTAQKLQACTNMGIGDPETDLVAAYTAAKA